MTDAEASLVLNVDQLVDGRMAGPGTGVALRGDRSSLMHLTRTDCTCVRATSPTAT